MATGRPGFIQDEAPSLTQWEDWVTRQVTAIHTSFTAITGAWPEDDDPSFAVVGQRAIAVDTGVEYVLVDNTVGAHVWQEYGRWKAWGTYEPALMATSVNPTLGTGPVQLGRWRRHGTHATVTVYLAFGTSAASGTGTYEINLPPELPAHPELYGAEELICGNGIAIDSSTGERRAVAVKIVGATTIRLEADSLTSAVTESNLIPWGDSDVVLSGTIEYETESP